jgi:hypothetical protein
MNKAVDAFANFLSLIFEIVKGSGGGILGLLGILVASGYPIRKLINYRVDLLLCHMAASPALIFVILLVVRLAAVSTQLVELLVSLVIRVMIVPVHNLFSIDERHVPAKQCCRCAPDE